LALKFGHRNAIYDKWKVVFNNSPVLNLADPLFATFQVVFAFSADILEEIAEMEGGKKGSFRTL